MRIRQNIDLLYKKIDEYLLKNLYYKQEHLLITGGFKINYIYILIIILSVILIILIYNIHNYNKYDNYMKNKNTYMCNYQL